MAEKMLIRSCKYFQKPTSLILPALLLSLFVILGAINELNQIPHGLSFRSGKDHSQSKWIDYTLSEAASKIAQNNTLIVSTASEPFLPMLNNWLISVARQNHQDKVLVIAEDYPTLFKINSKWPGHAVLLSPPPLNNSNSPYKFGSEGFNHLCNKRAQYLLQILELGFNVMFNDLDMVWFADPFTYMKGEHDVYFTDDQLGVKPLNHSHDLPPPRKDGTTYICACMIYIRATSGSKLLMKKWIEEIKAKPLPKWRRDNDQLAFNRALNKAARQVDMYLLPQAAFPPGGLYFSKRKWAETTKGMQVIIHNNYVVGLQNKIQRFRFHGLWLVDDHVLESPLGKL